MEASNQEVLEPPAPILPPLDRAVVLLGGVNALARALGVRQNVVSNWLARKSVPAEHCAAIECATGGMVSRKEFRPTDWQRIWPELVDEEC